MKKTEAKAFKERLLVLRARVRGDVNGMVEAALKKGGSEANGSTTRMPIHLAEIGSENFEQEFTLSLMENDEVTLGQIEAALERIEEGVYGLCTECDAKISKTRLNAIPYTAYCIKCASKLEGR